MEGVKIYGLCLERLRHQLTNAKQRVNGETYRVLLECYNTGELDDIIDILELYDVADRTPEMVGEKLRDLAYTVSELTRETLLFDYTENGHLALYFVLQEESVIPLHQEAIAV